MVVEHTAAVGEPGEQALARPFGQLELHRVPCLLLNDRRPVTDSTIHDHLADLQPDEVTAPEFAVDCQMEHRETADPHLALEMQADGSDLLGLEGRLGHNEAFLVPRNDASRMWDRHT
jgi:hypothetical protein